MENNLDRLTDLLHKRLFVPLEASGRHVHVTSQHAQILFGHDLTPVRSLSQPGQYLAMERVTILGPKGKMDGVAVLGPCRKDSQVEISVTDGRALGILPPVRMSGEIVGTPGITLKGSHGTVSLEYGVIVAQRHIHMTPEDARLHQVCDGMNVRLKALTKRPVVFEDVIVRVSKDYATFVHLDYDEANACGYEQGDLGMILS